MVYRFVLTPSLLWFAVCSAEAQTALPVVAEVEWTPLSNHCRRLLEMVDRNDAFLPAKTVHDLKALVKREPADPEMACAAVQKLLDPHCLLAVGINAESRVKVERGPAVVPLCLKRTTWVLIKVQNDGGVTHALRLRGPELIHSGERGDGRWLEARLPTGAPLSPELSGWRLEYRLLRLMPRESGKREATFQFDVGQGTQDLGFRAETSILFSVDKQK